MTLSWGTPTDGIGTRTTAHLNFTRTMAEDRYFLSAQALAGLRRRADRPEHHFPAFATKATR